MAEDAARARHQGSAAVGSATQAGAPRGAVGRFERAPQGDVQEVLNALVALGLARRLDDNRYAP